MFRGRKSGKQSGQWVVPVGGEIVESEVDEAGIGALASLKDQDLHMTPDEEIRSSFNLVAGAKIVGIAEARTGDGTTDELVANFLEVLLAGPSDGGLPPDFL